jgi:hypothetical protein
MQRLIEQALKFSDKRIVETRIWSGLIPVFFRLGARENSDADQNFSPGNQHRINLVQSKKDYYENKSSGAPYAIGTRFMHGANFSPPGKANHFRECEKRIEKRLSF